MKSALDETEFLTLLQNRVSASGYLVGRPRSKRELVERARASQSMIGWILSDFENRSWLTHGDGAYRATVTSKLAPRGFDNLVDVLGTDAKLQSVVEWLPIDAIAFDFEHLARATIAMPS